MSEADHILRVHTAARNAARAEKAYNTSMAARDEAIRQALADGVSDRALGIAATLNRTMVWHISSKEARRAPAPPEVIQDVHAIGADYPCCGRQARFGTADEDGVITRYCRECHITWHVSREAVVETPRGRVDRILWLGHA